MAIHKKCCREVKQYTKKVTELFNADGIIRSKAIWCNPNLNSGMLLCSPDYKVWSYTMSSKAKIHTVFLSRCIGDITDLEIQENKRVFTITGVWDGFCPIESPDKYPEVLISHNDQTYRGVFQQIKMGYDVPVEITCTLFE